MPNPPDGTGPLSLQMTLDHLNFEDWDTADDDELQFALNAAAEWVYKQTQTLEPYPVQMAVVEMVRHLWESQRGPAGGNLDDDTYRGLGLLGFSAPRRVRELIQPYVVINKPLGSFPDATGCWPDPVQSWPVYL